MASSGRAAIAATIGLGRGRVSRRPLPPFIIWGPALLVAAATALPLVYLVLRTAGAGSDAWDVLLRPRTVQILVRSVLLVVAVTAASVVLAVPLAWLTVRTDLPLRRVWAVLTVLPLVVPSYVGGLTVIAALGPRGMLQQLIAGPLGIERLPVIYGFPGALLVLSFLSYPYVLLSVRAALWNLDPALEEASRSLGYGSFATFRRVVLPLLRPAVTGGALLVALYTLSDFGAVSLLRYETFTWAIYLQYESAFDRTVAASLSLVLVAVAVGILIAEAGTRGRSRYHRLAAGAARPPARLRLGYWRWPAFAFCVLVVAIALAMPLAVLGYWLVRGIMAGESLSLVWAAAVRSLYVSGITAAIAVVAALPVAFLSARYPGAMSALVERVSYIGFALPGIVVALALVFFGANYAVPLYQTLPMLIFAYLVLFLPAALGAIRTALLQVSPHIEEAARGLGKGQLTVFLTVTLPLIRSGLLAAAALVFLVVVKELPATLILSPLGFKTLATSIWSAASSAHFARTAAPALVLIGVASVPMAFLVLRDWRYLR